MSGLWFMLLPYKGDHKGRPYGWALLEQALEKRQRVWGGWSGTLGTTDDQSQLLPSVLLGMCDKP